MVGDGHAVDASRRHQPAVGAGHRVRLRAVAPGVPGHQQQEEQRGQRDVEHVWVGVSREPPEQLCPGQQQPGGEGDHPPAGQDLDHGRCSGDGGGREDRLEQVHPEGRIAEGLEHDRGEPAEDHVARVAGGMGGAEDRPDRLELRRVPVENARRERWQDEKEGQDRGGRRCGHGQQSVRIGQAAEVRSESVQSLTSQASLPRSRPTD